MFASLATPESLSTGLEELKVGNVLVVVVKLKAVVELIPE